MVLQLASLELRVYGFIQDFCEGGGLDTSEIAFPEKRETFEITLQAYFERKLMLTGL